MIGSIRSFAPSLSHGIILAENGQEIPFSVTADSADIQGGDIVSFELTGNGQPRAENVIVRYRWTDMLVEKHRGLLNQFHSTVLPPDRIPTSA